MSRCHQKFSSIPQSLFIHVYTRGSYIGYPQGTERTHLQMTFQENIRMMKRGNNQSKVGLYRQAGNDARGQRCARAKRHIHASSFNACVCACSTIDIKERR